MSQQHTNCIVSASGVQNSSVGSVLGSLSSKPPIKGNLSLGAIMGSDTISQKKKKKKKASSG